MSDEWVMVPRKLAESQRNAMAMTHRHDYGIREEWERENIRKHMDQLHRAMLDAAPKPQEQAAQQCVDIGQELGLGYERKRAESAAEVFERGHTEGINDCLRNGLDWAHEYMGGLPGKRAKSERHEQEQAEPVATVRVHRTGGNAGIAWSGVPVEGCIAPPEGSPLYLRPDPDSQRLRDALKPFAAIDLTTNQAVDAMDVLRARRALEGK